jgi:hypothetical protein
MTGGEIHISELIEELKRDLKIHQCRRNSLDCGICHPELHQDCGCPTTQETTQDD